jgi:hypothetical protein
MAESREGGINPEADRERSPQEIRREMLVDEIEDLKSESNLGNQFSKEGLLRIISPLKESDFSFLTMELRGDLRECRYIKDKAERETSNKKYLNIFIARAAVKSYNAMLKPEEYYVYNSEDEKEEMEAILKEVFPGQDIKPIRGNPSDWQGEKKKIRAAEREKEEK